MAAICNKTKLNSHKNNDKFVPTYPEVTTAAFIITELLKSPKLMDFNYVCAVVTDTIGINILLKILFQLHKTATVDEMIKYNAIVQIVLDAIFPLHLKKESNSVLTFKSNSDTFLKIETKILNAYDLLPKAVKKTPLVRRKCPRIIVDLERDWGIKVEYNNAPIESTLISASSSLTTSNIALLNDFNANDPKLKLKTKLTIVSNDNTIITDDPFFILSQESSPKSTLVVPPESTNDVLISPTKSTQVTLTQSPHNKCDNNDSYSHVKKKQRVKFFDLDSSPKSQFNKNNNSFGTLMSGSKCTYAHEQTVKSDTHQVSAEIVSPKPIFAQSVTSIETVEPIKLSKLGMQTTPTVQTMSAEPIELINSTNPTDTFHPTDLTELTSTKFIPNKQPSNHLGLSGWSRVKSLLKSKTKSFFF